MRVSHRSARTWAKSSKKTELWLARPVYRDDRSMDRTELTDRSIGSTNLSTEQTSDWRGTAGFAWILSSLSLSLFLPLKVATMIGDGSGNDESRQVSFFRIVGFTGWPTGRQFLTIFGKKINWLYYCEEFVIYQLIKFYQINLPIFFFICFQIYIKYIELRCHYSSRRSFKMSWIYLDSIPIDYGLKQLECDIDPLDAVRSFGLKHSLW